MTGREVTAPKPERARRDVSGLAAPVAPVVDVTLEPARDERVIEVVLIAATEDGDRPL